MKLGNTIRVDIHKALLLYKAIIEEAHPEGMARSMGICVGLPYVAKSVHIWDTALDHGWRNSVQDAFRAWELFSGDRRYPVPSVDPDDTPFSSFWDNRNAHTPTLWTGEYGDLRRKLLDHLIDWYAHDQDDPLKWNLAA